jgi:hypothetical protein
MVGLCIAVSLVAFNFVSNKGWTIAVCDPDTFIYCKWIQY